MRIENLQNDNRKFIKSIGNFHVLEYMQDASVSPMKTLIITGFGQQVVLLW